MRRLNTTRAFHSTLLEPALGPLEAFVDTLTVEPPSQSILVSNVTGHVVGQSELLDGAYWSRHARSPVAFASGVRTLAGLSVDAIVEIRAPLRAGTDGVPLLARASGRPQRHYSCGIRQPAPTAPGRSDAREWICRGCGDGLRGWAGHFLCRIIRRRGAAQSVPAVLSIPTYSTLG